MIFIKDKAKVCRARAKKSADLKYDPIILSKREEYSKTRNVKIMQEIIKLSREKVAFQDKAFSHHMDTYEIKKDSLSDDYTEEQKSKISLKEFSNYLSDELLKI